MIIYNNLVHIFASIFLRSVSILFAYFYLRLQNCAFKSGFWNKNFVLTFPTCPADFMTLDLIYRPPVTYFSFRFKHSAQLLILRILKFMFLPQGERAPTQNKWKFVDIPWIWRQYDPAKHLYLPTSPRGFTTQKTNIGISTSKTRQESGRYRVLNWLVASFRLVNRSALWWGWRAAYLREFNTQAS